MWDMVNDPEGTRLTGTTAAFTREQVDAWCAGLAARDDRIDWAITHGSDEYLGEIVLNEIDAHDAQREPAAGAAAGAAGAGLRQRGDLARARARLR